MSKGTGGAAVEVADGDGNVAVLRLAARTPPDLETVDALARLQLAVRRFGWSLRLRDTCPDLTALIELAGLADVVPVAVADEKR